MNSITLAERIKNTFFTKQFFLFCIFSTLCVSGVFAGGDGIDTLDTWATKILDLLGGSWIKVICIVALIFEAIGVVAAGKNGGGGQLIKGFIPWIVGTIILLSASSIISYFLKDLSFSV